MSESWTQAEIDEATASHAQELELQYFASLRSNAYTKLRDAEKAWHEYFAALPVGKDREYAHDVFENVRLATRL